MISVGMSVNTANARLVIIGNPNVEDSGMFTSEKTARRQNVKL